MQTSWTEHYAQRIQSMKSSAIRELLKVTEQPDVISFAGGLPAPEVFPVAEVEALTKKILQERGAQALQYGPTEGYYPLRELIARQMSGPELEVKVENVLITTGSQQALDLVGKIFLDPADLVLVESPTYMGALQAWNAYGARYLSVPTDEDGMQVEQLEGMLQQARPKWIYALPNFQNPAGITLSLARRQRLVEIANRYNVPIVEDDAYVRLSFDGTTLPSLFQLAGRLQAPGEAVNGNNVLYLGTFSKILSPGLRLGWVVAPAQVIDKLVQAKQGVDLHTPSLNQMIAHEIVSNGFLEQHILYIRKVYQERRDVMLAAMQRHFPAEVHWTRPAGGMFLWVTLPAEMNTQELLREALVQNVAFVPGNAFHAQGGGENTMRLNFSNATREQIETGIARLAQVLRNHKSTTLSALAH